MITFTSMKPSDLQGTSGSNEGVILLSNWLEYSKTGKIDSGQITGKNLTPILKYLLWNK